MSSSRPQSSSSSTPPARPPLRPHERLPDAQGGPASRQRKTVHFNTPAYRPSVDTPYRPSVDAAMSEQSPLLAPTRVSYDEPKLRDIPPIDDEDDWLVEKEEESKSTLYLLLLTLTGLGLQIGWSVETSNGSPFLLSLGISKSLLALVWIAGPLSGTLVQPYVGLKSDNCRSKWGKRRPFIVGGAVATIISLMLLSWTREIVGGFLGIFGQEPGSKAVKWCSIIWAVLLVYVLDFAINVLQAAVRAYIVDCAPTHQQEAANAWIMRTTGFGNILGYLAGYVDLPRLFPFLGNSQFKVLGAIASIAIAVTVAISCSTVHERDPRREGPPTSQGSVLDFFKSLVRSIRKLPLQIRRVCEVQFFAWIGWFPFLFYITTYIGEIYAEPFFAEDPEMSDADIDAVWEKATRIGTLALLVFALTTFASSIILPIIIPPTFRPPATPIGTPMTPTPMTPTTPSSMHSSDGYFSHKPKKPNRTLSSTRSLLEVLQIRSLTLRRAWLLSHLMFAALMWLTLFVRTTAAATVLVALIGIPWALTSWAPFALIASEISKRDAIRRGMLRPQDPTAAREAEDISEEADQAGVILGIHNVAIAAPQVIATLVSSIIFRLLQKPRGSVGDDSVGWVLRFGGLCAIVAAVLTRRVGEENEDAARR